MPIRTPAAPCALLALALAAPARSQAVEPDAAITLDAIVVTHRRDPDNPLVVGAARERTNRTPGAVAVIASESYRNRMAQGVSDVLRNVPGVLAQKRYGEESRLSIRGSGLGQGYHARGVLLAQDGVPFTQADGFSDFQGVDPGSARHIEVYKGANALRFGAAQLGGAVNLVTPTGRTAPFDTLAQLEAGAFATTRAQLQLARRNESWDAFAAISALETEGYRDHSEQSHARLTANLGRTFGEDREMRLMVQVADVQQSLPAMLSLEQALETPRYTPPHNIAQDYSQDQRLRRVSLRTRWRTSPSSVVEAAVWGSDKSLHHPIFQIIAQEGRDHGAFARVDWAGALGGLRSDAVYGVSWRSGDSEGRRYVNEAGRRGRLTADGVQQASSLDVFGEVRTFVTPRLAIVAGGALGWAWRDYADRLTPSNSDSIDYDWVAPRIGLIWEAEDGAQVFANLTRSVEPPTYSALVQPPGDGFVPVDVQTAWTAELGTRGRRGALEWDLAVYRSELDGEMLNFVVGPDVPAATFNAGRTLHQGLEAALDWSLPLELAGGDWRLRQVYTWSNFRFIEDSTWGDNVLPVQPEHLYRAELTFRRGAGLSVTPSLEWRMSEPWVDYANTMKAPAYAVVGLNLAWRLNDAVTLFADLRNLTDERYVGEFVAVTDARTASTAVFYPGEGRSGFLGLRVAL